MLSGIKKLVASTISNSCNSTRRLSTISENTSEAPKGLHKVTILSKTNLSPTIKHFKIEKPDNFEFQPGQWVELHSATLDNGTETPITNGFSIASDPLQTDVLDFAIKETQMPIVQWLHHKAKILMSEATGTMGYPPKPLIEDPSKSLVLIAGGIGITPLLSIVTHIWKVKMLTGRVPELPKAAAKVLPNKTFLLQQVNAEADLIWEPRLRAITSKDSSISAHFYVSGEKKLSKTAPKAAKAGAVDMAAIQKLGVDVKNSVYYVCGPLGMIQDLTAKLEAAGVPKECIITERWL